MEEWEWDEDKNEANIRKHGISFEQALEAFADPNGIEKEDLAHSAAGERRFWRTGRIAVGRIVTVVYTVRAERHRIISAQERRRERREYEKSSQKG